jgi:hypothetical protein
MDGEPISDLLERLRNEGRSSPSGRHWAAFHDLLCRHARAAGVPRPPMPLILAASGESDNSKHQRLGDQLRWAEAHGVLPEALRLLANLQPDQWNEGNTENWYRSS